MLAAAITAATGKLNPPPDPAGTDPARLLTVVRDDVVAGLFQHRPEAA